ncbi:MAG: cation diffusion facilitator family transporter [Acidobacteriota bacterium]
MLTEWLVRRFVANPEQVDSPRVREAYGVLEGRVSIGINLVVFAVKIVPGVLIGSIALIADAFHSLGDVLSSIVVILGFKLSARPSDPEHPFGHGRAESIACLVVALMLFLTEAIAASGGEASFHDLRLVGSADTCYVIFDLQTEGGQIEPLAAQLQAAITGRFPAVAKVAINLEPRYVY